MLAYISLMMGFWILVIVVVAVLILKDTKWFDKTADKVTTIKSFEEPETDDVIDKVEQTKSALGDRSKERKEQAKALNQEANKIDGYLDTDKKETTNVKPKEGKPMK